MDRGEFYLSMEVLERAANFKWEVIVIYGPDDHRRSEAFLAELHTKIGGSQLPVVIGGYFNLLRMTREKNNARVDLSSMQRLNDSIADLGLLSLRAITRIDSDHVPLLLSSQDERPRPLSHFRFETFWLRLLGFIDVVREHSMSARAETHRAMFVMDEWNHLAKRFKRFMKGWGVNVGRDLRVLKSSLLAQIQALDLWSDDTGLSSDDWALRYSLKDSLMDIYSKVEDY
ncbi:hypothetical protein D1007_00055 [Hordeum vulgare]|nr:hypothetical protein D1007_00055 [Hordeum vulgare]